MLKIALLFPLVAIKWMLQIHLMKVTLPIPDFSSRKLPHAATAVVAMKKTDVNVQNQLDIGDTLSCLAFVQDTRL